MQEEIKKTRKIAIFMEIDETDTENASGAARTDNINPRSRHYLRFPDADETYSVTVTNATIGGNNPNGQGRDGMLDDAAHELGHVLSSVFRVPGGMHQDPRQRGEFAYAPPIIAAALQTPEQDKRIMKNESLAWKIAEKIRPELNQINKDHALQTYRDTPKDRRELQRRIINEVLELGL